MSVKKKDNTKDSTDIDNDESKLMELMKVEYVYPNPSDPEFQYKLYKKREFYYHRTPVRPGVEDYADIKEYRDNICAKSFALHPHQAMLSNFINPDTPYRGILLFHGLGTGKCCRSDAYVLVNGLLMKIQDIWDKYSSSEIVIDSEGGEWSVPKEELIINSINANGKIIKNVVKRLYREKINSNIREIELENGYKTGITMVHKLLKDNGWSNDLTVGDHVAIPKKLYNCPEKNTVDVT
jgi:hypothetical protein